MAQTNNTTIQLYYSSTAVTVPSASNLAFGELAINILDEKLYFKNSSGVVKLLATPAGAEGTVESVSVVSANGFAGTVATSTTFPAITLTTTITGILKGNGTAISAATSGTDYAPATSGTSILYGNGAGGFSNATVASPLTFTGGTLGLGPVTSGAAILYGDGAGGISNVTVASSLSFTTGTLAVANAPSLTTTNWTVSETGGKLYFAYGGTNKASLDSSGNFVVVGNVTAFGTIT
jgi:hypothetical protein